MRSAIITYAAKYKLINFLYQRKEAILKLSFKTISERLKK